MVENRISQQQRPQTPSGLTLAEKIMWKRGQMNQEQSRRKHSLPENRNAFYTEQVRNIHK